MIAIAALYIVLGCLGIGCPIRFLTGISCAGCGMSRAWLSLLRLDFAAAFAYHPLFWVPPCALILWLLRRHLPRKLCAVLLWVGVGLFLLVYILRMINPADEVVVFRPAEGFIARRLF